MAKINLDKTLIRDLNALLEETGLRNRNQRGKAIRSGCSAKRVIAATPVATTSVPPVTDEKEFPVLTSMQSIAHGRHRISLAKTRRSGIRFRWGPGERRANINIIEAMKVMNPIPAPKQGPSNG